MDLEVKIREKGKWRAFRVHPWPWRHSSVSSSSWLIVNWPSIFAGSSPAFQERERYQPKGRERRNGETRRIAKAKLFAHVRLNTPRSKSYHNRLRHPPAAEDNKLLLSSAQRKNFNWRACEERKRNERKGGAWADEGMRRGTVVRRSLTRVFQTEEGGEGGTQLVCMPVPGIKEVAVWPSWHITPEMANVKGEGGRN